MQIKPDDIEFPEDDEDDKPLRRSRARKKRKRSDLEGEGEWFEPTGEPNAKPLDDTVGLSDLELSVGIKRNKDGTPRKKSKDPEFKNGKFKEQKDLFDFPQDPNLRDPSRKFQVWSLTQLYSVDFLRSRIGIKKCVFNKRTIKVCISCC